MSFVGHTITHSPIVSPSGLRYAMASAFPFNHTSTDITAASAHAAMKTSGSPRASPGPKVSRQSPKLPDGLAFNQHHSIIALREQTVAGRPRRSSFAASATCPPGSPFASASPRQPHQQRKPRRLSFAELPAPVRDLQLFRAGAGGAGLGFVVPEEEKAKPSVTKSRRESIAERVPTPYPQKDEAESYFDPKFGASEESK
ncbi:hypothetical protein FRC04_005861 [Tulasnella sp. 424]|nr:hypothetical protein FRC04_005861 [Tulasnella sp. 424]KAG8976005.1 hypothetical protein FRC05_004636 [Tulasnella sp. 425]